MIARRRDESGETLAEIVIALVIIGLIVGSFFAAIATTATASRSHRDLVSADAALRNYAEAAKQAVRVTCLANPAGTPFTVDSPGVTASAVGGFTCPNESTAKRIDITATLPSGVHKSLSVVVRKP
jgi:Tfp pilus assembly protein PilV